MFANARPIAMGNYMRRPKGQLHTFLRNDLNATKVAEVGSARSPIMNDVDVAIETPLSHDEVQTKLVEHFGSTNVKKTAFGFSFLMDTLQVDLFIGDVNYLKWARAGTYYTRGHHSPIKGVFRNLLINATLRVVSRSMFPASNDLERTRYVLDYDKGLYLVEQTRKGANDNLLKEWKTTKRTFVSNVPDEIVRFIFDEPDVKAYYRQTFLGTSQLVQRSKRTRDVAKEIFKEFLDDVGSMDESAFGQLDRETFQKLLRSEFEAAKEKFSKA